MSPQATRPNPRKLCNKDPSKWSSEASCQRMPRQRTKAVLLWWSTWKSWTKLSPNCIFCLDEPNFFLEYLKASVAITQCYVTMLLQYAKLRKPRNQGKLGKHWWKDRNAVHANPLMLWICRLSTALDRMWYLSFSFQRWWIYFWWTLCTSDFDKGFANGGGGVCWRMYASNGHWPIVIGLHSIGKGAAAVASNGASPGVVSASAFVLDGHCAMRKIVMMSQHATNLSSLTWFI